LKLISRIPSPPGERARVRGDSCNNV